MSSAVSSTSAALGRPFLFDADPEAPVYPKDAKKPARIISQVLQSTIKIQQSTIPLIAPASRLEIRPAPEMACSGIATLDTLTGGLPRGSLTEICGPASSGRTSIMLAALAAATHRGEFCALVDASDALDPHSAAAAGIDLDRFLWVRCGEDLPRKNKSTETSNVRRGTPALPRTSYESEHRLEQLLRATDLLLESGGFGLIALDLADVPAQSARRIPLTTWFRFRRAVEHKATILLTIEQQAIAGSCSSLLLQLGILSTQYSVLSSNTLHEDADAERNETLQPAHAQLLTAREINVELVRSRVDRKPARSVMFQTKTAWAAG